MCYEYWHSEEARAEEEAARKRAQEMIEKAKSTKPVAPQEAPALSEAEQKDTVPA